MGAKVTLTRILNHYRFDDVVKRPDVSRCAYSRDQLLKDSPEFIALRDEHYAKKKVQHPAAGQAAPATAVRMVAAAAAAAVAATSGQGNSPSRGLGSLSWALDPQAGGW